MSAAAPRNAFRAAHGAVCAWLGLLVGVSAPALPAARLALNDTFTAVCFDGTASCAEPANTAGYTSSADPHGGWSCTLDTVTGLTWALHTGSDPIDGDVGQANTAGLCGYTDWRMPHRDELASIVDFGNQNPAIDTTYFPGTSGVFFLTADGLWGVDFSDGSSYSAGPPVHALRLVRRGASPAVPTYHDNLDGTVTDNDTELMWDQHATAGCISNPNPNSCSLTEALQAVVTANATSHLGYADWRLPNFRELYSLVNITASSPALFPGTGFDGNTWSGVFWTSTPYAPAAGEAWGIAFGDGGFTPVTSGLALVRLVRDAQSTATTITNAPPLQGTFGSTYAIDVSVVRTRDSATPNIGSVSCTLTPQPSGAVVALPAAAVSNGSATCVVSAAQAAGGYSVVAQFNTTDSTTFAASTSNAVTLTILQAGQALTFPAQTPASRTFSSGGTFAINPLATSAAPNSGQPVVYSSLTSAVCTVSGTTVTIVGAGACTLAADQAANTNYAAAPEQTQGVTITAATQAITFTSTPPALAPVGGNYGVSATGGGSGNAVTFSIDAASTAGACTVSGNAVAFTGAGTCIVDANQAGNGNYTAAPQVQQSIKVIVNPILVPTLSTWGLLLLVGVLGTLGLARARRA